MDRDRDFAFLIAVAHAAAVAAKAMADGSATRAVTQKPHGAVGKIATDGTFSYRLSLSKPARVRTEFRIARIVDAEERRFEGEPWVTTKSFRGTVAKARTGAPDDLWHIVQ
jgi:hypothetical protein